MHPDLAPSDELGAFIWWIDAAMMNHDTDKFFYLMVFLRTHNMKS